ncbi:odorant receptor 10-like [Xylocopa sonorina]|uniref:odorant receptor 10-like n=1 Tax=Xylocopa sonorina TaxID=1818115 RepID=UPI00403A8852
MSSECVVIETSLDRRSDYSLQLNRWFLKPIGAWPASPSTSRLKKSASIVLNVVCYGFMLSSASLALLHMILEEKSFYVNLKTLGPVSHWLVSSLNYTTLLLRSKDIRYCIEHMEIDWRTVRGEEDQKVMMRNAKFGRYVATFCAAFMQGGVLCFCFVTALTTEAIQVGNETRIVHVLPCPVYRGLLNVDESPTNEIVLITQVWSAFIANSSTVGIFSLAAVLAAHACGQLNIVMMWITDFVNETRDQKKSAGFKQIGTIVEHHLRALNFVSCIENVMNRICFLELFRCTLDICIIGYWILMEWADHDVQNLTTYVVMLLSICFNIFIMCYIGEVLTEQCKKVGEVVYMTNWYYLPDKMILDLILIIARSSVVVEITAGKMVHMSIYTFGDVVKTGFAYLNLLRQMTQ